MLGHSRPASAMYPKSLLATLYILEFLHVFYRNRMPFKAHMVCGTALAMGYAFNFSYLAVLVCIVCFISSRSYSSTT